MNLSSENHASFREGNWGLLWSVETTGKSEQDFWTLELQKHGALGAAHFVSYQTFWFSLSEMRVSESRFLKATPKYSAGLLWTF